MTASSIRPHWLCVCSAPAAGFGDVQIESAADHLRSFAERHYARVRQESRRLISDRATADDLTQEVFLRVMVGIQAGLEVEEEWAYLRGVMRNVMLEYIRSKRRRHLLSAEALSLVVSPERGPGAEMEEEDVLTAVRKLIEKLDPDEQAVIVGRYFFGCSNEELMQELNASYRTVTRKHHSALERLKSLAERFRLTPGER